MASSLLQTQSSPHCYLVSSSSDHVPALSKFIAGIDYSLKTLHTDHLDRLRRLAILLTLSLGSSVMSQYRLLILGQDETGTFVGGSSDSIFAQPQMDPYECAGVRHRSENNNLETLQKELDFYRERDSLHVLWQTSQRTVEALETELKTYQGYETGSSRLKAYSLSDLELKLETALNDYIDLEKKYKELNNYKTDLEKELKNKGQKILDYKTKHSEFENKILELSRHVDESKVHLELEIKNNENIKTQLTQCQKDCVNYLRREVEAKSKVAEALQLFDMVATQRDEAYTKISETSGEIMLHELQLRHFVVEAKLAINRVMKLPSPLARGLRPLAGSRRRHNAIIQLNMEDSTFHIDYDDCEHSEFGRLNNSVAFELFEVFYIGLTLLT
ncbi:hypothetical protein EVAR_99890_1 [Eumeta japonica]|uniref:Uncharacterized protein n=1 Tax=Eumeta variegata TaxID=151549 RepID=A0A4C1ZG77_EUMVA|nr:hypothetical protein EVAR_99890_1 [Eumeta japonica]